MNCSAIPDLQKHRDTISDAIETVALLMRESIHSRMESQCLVETYNRLQTILTDMRES